MFDLRVLAGFSSLLVWIALLIKKGVHPSAAPLAAVCGTSLWFTFFGCIGLLLAGGWLFFGLTLLAGGYLVWLALVKKEGRFRVSYGLLFFIGMSLLAFFLLLARSPMFTTWDEFSFWGTAGKLTKLNNELYPTAPIGWIWPATQTPATIVFNYFMQFFGGGFSEWQTYFAVNVLQFAALAACLSPFEKKHWEMALPAMVVLFAAPFLFVHYGEIRLISQVYLDSLADLTMGLLFGGILAAHYGTSQTGKVRWLPVFLGISVLTITKDTGLLFALVAVMLVFLDVLLQKKVQKPPLIQRLKPAGIVLGAGLGAVLLPFMGWSLYLKMAVAVNRFNLGGIKNVGMLEMPLLALREAFSPDKSEKFVEVMSRMPVMFFTERITLLGSGAMVAAICIGMSLFAAAIAKDGVQRRQNLIFSLFSGLGFAAYYLFIALTYIYIFRPEQTFESYERYLYPYYVGWFIASFSLLAASGVNSRLRVEGKAAVLAVALLFSFRFYQNIPLARCIIGVNSAEYNSRREFAAEVQALTARLQPEGRTFIVSSHDDGSRWFTYSYQMLPWQADYSFGGGSLIEKTTDENGQVSRHELDAGEWEEYLMATGCTTVFIDDADENFRSRYGELFEDGMEGYFTDGQQLYAVQTENGGVRLTVLE